MERKFLKEFALEENLIVLVLSNAILVFGFSVFNNFLPKFYEFFGLSATLIGLLFTIQNGFQQIFHLIGGYWSDNYGRKKIYLFSLILGIIALSIFYFSRVWIFFIPAILLLGISDGIGGTATSTLITESLEKGKRATGWSIIFSISSVTALVGVVIGGFLLDMFGIFSGFKFGILLALVCSFIAIAIIKLYLKETLRVKLRKKRKFGIKFGLNFVKEIPKSIKFYFLFVGIWFFGASLIKPYLILYSMNEIKISAFQFSTLVAITHFLGITFILIGGKISDVYSRKFVLLSGLVLEAIAISIFLISKTYMQLIFFAILQGLASIGSSSLIPYAADHSYTTIRAKIIGLTNFVMMLSCSVSPLIGGYLYSLAPFLPFLITLGLNFIAFFLGWKILS